MTVTNICVYYCANYKSQRVKWWLSYVYTCTYETKYCGQCVFLMVALFYTYVLNHNYIGTRTLSKPFVILSLMKWQIQKSNWIEVDLHFSTYNTTYFVLRSIISMSCHNVNPRPLVPHVGPKAGTSLVHAMACRLFGVEPLTEPVMTSHHSQPM